MTAMFAALRDAFLTRWQRRYPDEASTLGIAPAPDTPPLPDPSRAALEAHAREYAELAAALASIGPLEHEDALDARMLAAWLGHEVRRIARGAHLTNVEHGLTPYHLVRHLLAHAQSEAEHALAQARIEAIPAFLAAHQETLRAGIADGRAAHAQTVEFIATHSVPTIARELRTLGRGAAADAYEAHAAFLATELAPRAKPSAALGAIETDARLREGMGIARGPEDLVADARAELARAHDALLRTAREVPALRDARTVSDVRTAIGALYATPLAAREDRLLASYRALLERATEFARDHGLVPLDGPLAVRVAPLPPGISDLVHAQNWAAPLLAPRPRADFLVRLDPRQHPAMAAPLLTVHEGVPGHALQSLAFARAHRASPRLARFLCVTDDAAMARSYFGPMLAIEGWASWVEHRMLELGFYEGAAAVYAWNVRAIRAARVIADLGVHRETQTPADAHAFLVDEAFLPPAIAAREVARYQRVPLQALTYLTGALAIERTLAPARAAGNERRAIDRLLAAGPVPPHWLTIA